MSPVCLGRQIEEPKNSEKEKKQKTQRNQKTKKQKRTNNSSELILQKPQVQRPLEICLFLFICFFSGFLETPNSQTSGTLYYFLFMNTQSIWSHLKCLYLWQKLQKNICKSMENRTLRDTRSANKHMNKYVYEFICLFFYM